MIITGSTWCCLILLIWMSVTAMIVEWSEGSTAYYLHPCIVCSYGVAHTNSMPLTAIDSIAYIMPTRLCTLHTIPC